MPLITVIIVIALVGFALYVVNKLIPMEATVKQILKCRCHLSSDFLVAVPFWFVRPSVGDTHRASVKYLAALLVSLALTGCAGPRFADGARALLADKCNPVGECNVGKRP
jgi:hypothetical protein